MKNNITLKLIFACLVTLGATIAQATPITWSLDATFNDGNTAYGTYVFDADLGAFLGFDITTSSGNSYGFVNNRSPGRADLFSAVATQNPLAGDAQMFLQLAESMTNAGGVIDILPGFIWSGGSGFSWEGICTSDNCETSGASRDVAFGQVYTGSPSQVPVPATLPLLLSGLAALGLVRRRR